MSATSACPFCGAEPGVACQGGQPTCADRIANEEGAAQRLAAGMHAATFHDWDGRAGDLADAPAKVRDAWFDAGRALLAYLRDRGRPQSIEDLVAFLRAPAGETSIQATHRALSRMPRLSDME